MKSQGIDSRIVGNPPEKRLRLKEWELCMAGIEVMDDERRGSEVGLKIWALRRSIYGYSTGMIV